MTRVREWKPGDVALTKSGGTVARTAQHRWVLLDDGHGIDIEDERIARPLAVIDFEDREQVERLIDAYVDVMDADGRSGDKRGAVPRMQAALREFANPVVKPEEPTGLGAVVRTMHDELYVRDKTTTTVAHWKRARGEERSQRHRWDDLQVVEVLTPGVVVEDDADVF